MSAIPAPEIDPTTPLPARALRPPVGAVWAMLVPLVLILVADRASKAWVRAVLWEPPRTLVVAPGWLEFTPVANRGIAFGLLQESGGLLAVIAVVILGAIALRNWRQVLSAPWLFRFALGLIGGGAFGNLVDRVELGYVADFIRVPRIPIFQVFNVADAAIVVGTATLVLALWRSERKAPAPSPQPAAAPEATDS